MFRFLKDLYSEYGLSAVLFYVFALPFPWVLLILSLFGKM